MGDADELRDPRPVADQRDELAAVRDETADQRDDASYARDVDAESQDRAAQDRDAETTLRLRNVVERLGRLRDEILDRLDRLDSDGPEQPPRQPGSGPPTPPDTARRKAEDRAALEALFDETIGVIHREAAAQGAAAGDRRRSARDRTAAAEDRHDSAADRDRSAADREEAAIDREQVDFRTDLGVVRRALHTSQTSAARTADLVNRALAETRERITESQSLLVRLPDQQQEAPERGDDPR